MRVRLAPSWMAASLRSLLLLGAALLVGAVVYSINGAPTMSRKSKFDELERFAPSAGGGIAELATEVLVLIGVTWLCRDGLRIRLEARPMHTPTRFEQSSSES